MEEGNPQRRLKGVWYKFAVREKLEMDSIQSRLGRMKNSVESIKVPFEDTLSHRGRRTAIPRIAGGT